MVRGAATCWPHCPSPKRTQHHTKRFPLSLQFFQWKESTQGRHPAPPALWVTSWDSPLWSIPQGLWGNLWGLTTMNLIVMEERGEASNNQNLHLCRPSSYLEHPSSGPKQWVALLICKAKSMAQSDQGTWQGAGLPDFGPQRKSIPVLEHGLPWLRQGSWVIAQSTVERSSQPHLIRKAGQKTWKLHSPTTLKQSMAGRTDHPQGKPRGTVQPEDLGRGSADSRWQIKSLAQLGVSLPVLPRQGS